jgi:hypothetical protein
MRWLIAVLVILSAGWMLFDGSRALIVGDYITPKSGQHAGQLGPWAEVVQKVGIKPRSTLMKLIFVLYGLSFVMIMIAFLLKISWTWWAMIVMAVLGLLYVPFGALINILIIALLLTNR